jgi:hypothetical protein
MRGHELQELVGVIEQVESQRSCNCLILIKPPAVDQECTRVDELRVYLRRITAPCAHLFGRLCRSTQCRWDSIMIQAYDGPKHLMALAADVPPMAVRHLRDQAPHVQPLQHPADRMALATVFSDVLGRSVQRHSDLGVAEATQQVVAIQHRLEQAHVRRAGRAGPSHYAG